MPAGYVHRRRRSLLDRRAGSSSCSGVRSRQDPADYPRPLQGRCPSGQRELAVNQSLRLRRFESSPAHTFYASQPEVALITTDSGGATRRNRRIAGGALALAGLLNVVSALTPPLGGRVQLLRLVVPMDVGQTAAALVAAAGVALLL